VASIRAWNSVRKASSTSTMAGARSPSSTAIEVMPLSGIPQGRMWEK